MSLLKAMTILLQFEKRLQVHTFTKEDGVYEHNIKKCPRCIAIEVIKS